MRHGRQPLRIGGGGVVDGDLPQVSGCLILVVNRLTLSGDSQLNSTGCSAAGVPPPTVQTVALAE